MQPEEFIRVPIHLSSLVEMLTILWTIIPQPYDRLTIPKSDDFFRETHRKIVTYQQSYAHNFVQHEHMHRVKDGYI